MTTLLHRMILLFLLGAVGSGCASLRDPMAGTVHKEREKRAAQTTQRMEQQRDSAEFAAALERWNQQDVRGCREQLTAILDRNPKSRDAQLLMADVLLASDDAKGALARVEELAKTNPKDADVQYALGLTLDANRRPADALPHYAEAARLAPTNEVYAVCYRAAKDAVGGLKTALPDRMSEKKTTNATASVSPSERGTASASDSSTTPSTELRVLSTAPKATAAKPKEAEKSSSLLPAAGPTVVQTSAVEPRDGAAGCTGEAKKTESEALLKEGCAALADSPQTALRRFLAAADIDRDNRQIPLRAATAALQANQPQVAVDLLVTIRGRFAPSADISQVLGMAYYRLGEYSSSQSALLQALSLDKSHALAYFLLGCTKAKLGESAAAEGYFRQAEALDPRYAVR